MERLEKENSDLTHRLEVRKLVQRAKGILQQDLNIAEQEAYLMLQRQSQQRRLPMKDIARAVVLSDAVTRGTTSYRNVSHSNFEFDFASVQKQNATSSL